MDTRDMGEAAVRIAERLGREWPAGSRLPSVRALARQLDIANATAHRAIKELAAKGLLVTRPRSGVFVASIATGDDAKLRRLHGKHIALFRPNKPGEDLIDRMVHGFHRQIDACQCRLTEHTLSNSPVVVPDDADAVVLFNPDFSFPPAGGPPLTIITTRDLSRLPRTQNYDIVSIEQEQGGMIAGQTLRATGAAAACFIGRGTSGDFEHAGGPYEATSQRRLNGFLQGWGGDGADVELLYTGSYGQLSGGFAVRQLVKQTLRPQAVFAASDEIAMGFIIGAAAVGLMPARDYQIVGFDGQRVGQEQPPLPLTTIQAPAHDMGRRAAQLLIDRLLDPRLPVRRVSLGCDLLPGATAMPAALSCKR